MKNYKGFAVVILVFLAAIFLAGCEGGILKQAPENSESVPVVKGAKFVGSEACADCHEGLVRDFKSSIHGRIASFEVKPANATTGCESCHGPGSKHVEEGNPSYILNPSKLSAKQVAKICSKCHTGGELADWRGSEHPLNNISCTKCHIIHKGKDKLAYRDKLGYRHKHVKDASLKKPEPELCYTCHKDIMASVNYPNHHPIKEGKMVCSDCHNPHGSEVKPLLRTDERQNELCFKCHMDKEGPFAFEHAPVVEKCTICHDPHGTVADNLLKQNEPFLCLQCHEMHFHSSVKDLNVPEDYQEAHAVQKLMTTRCTQCHPAIHGSDLPSLGVPGGGSRLLR